MDLFDVDLASILPDSIMQDASMQAAATAVQRQLVAVSWLMRNVAIWARLDELTEPILSTLAWQLHVDDFEGWALAETDEQKRRLLRESLIIHRYKGTRWSLVRVFTLLDMEGTVQEWFEYDGDPYLFRVDLVLTRDTTETLPDDVLALIFALKNVRSHLDRLRIIPTSTGTVHTAAVSWSGARVLVLPAITRRIEVTATPRLAAGTWGYASGTVWPI